MREYDQIAEWYAATRSHHVGVLEVEAFARSLPQGARVLDLGCGTGLPLSRALAQHGLEVEALDSSAEMVARYRSNVPGVTVRCGRIQDARFPPETYDGVVAWSVLFHLSATDQRTVLEDVAEWLRPGGRFLFTSGDLEGERAGVMHGATFHYVSLDVPGYQKAIEAAGMRLMDHHRDAWDNCVYVAEKPR